MGRATRPPTINKGRPYRYKQRQLLIAQIHEAPLFGGLPDDGAFFYCNKYKKTYSNVQEFDF